VTFLVRVWFPIECWVDLAPFIGLELAHIRLSLFALGIVAQRRD
jgi:hypothetical protein